MTAPAPTLFRLAADYLARHSGGSREGRFAFLMDDTRMKAAAQQEPIGALALAMFEEFHQEAVRDGFSTDDPEAFKAELARRSRQPEAIQRFRQRVARILN